LTKRKHHRADKHSIMEKRLTRTLIKIVLITLTAIIIIGNIAFIISSKPVLNMSVSPKKILWPWIHRPQSDIIIITTNNQLLALYNNSVTDITPSLQNTLNAPRNIPLNTIRIIDILRTSNALFATTRHHGLFFSDDNGLSWRICNTGLEYSDYKNKEPRYHEITSISINNKHMILTTRFHVYYSTNNAQSWQQLHNNGMSGNTRFTASVLYHPTPDETWVVVGTTFNGTWRLKQNADKWKKMRAYQPSRVYSDDRRRFWDEITGLSVDPQHPEILYSSSGYHNTICRYSYTQDRWFRIGSFNELAADIHYLTCSSNSISFIADNVHYTCSFSSNRSALALITATPGNTFGINNYIALYNKTECMARRIIPREIVHSKKLRADNVRSLYINPYSITPKTIAHVMNLIKHGDFNAVVFDFKDDAGNLLYGSKLKITDAVGANRPYPRLINAIKKMHDAGVYIIARCVVFKDKRLFSYDNNAYAVWDTQQQAPWQYNDSEFWVDPYSDFVKSYNVSIVKEIAESGNVDEIQFDYIRFPSDPGKYRFYRHRPDKMKKIETMEDFLSRARAAITIPISVDVYGYNGIYRMGNWIAQDIDTFGKYVDVICPMIYPSHYHNAYFEEFEGLKRDYNIVYHSVRRAQRIVHGTVIRPYLQAFAWHASHWGTEYIMTQVNAVRDNGVATFSMWNARGNYTIFNDIQLSPKSDIAITETTSSSNAL